MKHREVIEVILDNCTRRADPATTVDVFKHGNPEDECRGIATSVAPTIAAIEKTGELGYNLLIVHEPTFWTHDDRREWLEGDPVYEAKKALLDKYGITVWRFHDQMHGNRPDLVFGGLTRELGWEEYDIPDHNRSKYVDRSHKLSTLWELPGIRFEDIANMFREKLGLEGIHYVGDKDTIVRKAAVAFHEFEYEPQEGLMQIMKDENIDLLIPGESVNWTTQFYVRDSAALGMPKAMLLIGHFNIESLGMKNLADYWFPKILGDSIPMQYVPAGDSYKYL